MSKMDGDYWDYVKDAAAWPCFEESRGRALSSVPGRVRCEKDSKCPACLAREVIAAKETLGRLQEPPPKRRLAFRVTSAEMVHNMEHNRAPGYVGRSQRDPLMSVKVELELDDNAALDELSGVLQTDLRKSVRRFG